MDYPSQPEPTRIMEEDPLTRWTNPEQYEIYMALLGLAESLKKQGEPEGAHHCLLAVLGLQLPYAVSARIYCEIGKLLLEQSTDFDLSKQYLEQAYQMGQSAVAGSALEDAKLDAASSLARLYVAQDNIGQARDILHVAIEQSQHSPYWQCTFIFQLAHVFMLLQDNTDRSDGCPFAVAGQILTLGESFSARYQAQYLTLLFQLTRSYAQLRSKQYQTALVSLADINSHLQSPSLLVTPIQREELRFYMTALEAMCRLNMGQAKTVRPHIQNLQNSLDALTQLRARGGSGAGQPLEMFALAPASMFPVITYAVSAQFFGLIGYHDKLERVFGRCTGYLQGIEGLDDSGLQDDLRCCMYQAVIPATLTTCRLNQALHHLTDYLSICEKSTRLVRSRRSQLHALLGLCALQFGYNEVAESQLNMASRCCTSNEMMAFISLNQGVMYLRQQRLSDLSAVLQRTRSDQLLGMEHVPVQCASLLLQALVAVMECRGTDGKMLLRSALQMSNEEDVNQLMGVALALMARNCAAMGEYQDVIKVARTACDLAEKIPDHALQVCSLTSLAEVYGMMGDYANQATCTNSIAAFNQREAVESQTLHRNPKLSMLQWTGTATT